VCCHKKSQEKVNFIVNKSIFIIRDIKDKFDVVKYNIKFVVDVL